MEHRQYEFDEVVTSVEERFRRVYMNLGEARAESKVEYEQISTGWWLVIRHMGIALRLGDKKPAIDAGDTVTINISRKNTGR